MDISIIAKNENKLLERIEVDFSLVYDGRSPTRDEIRKAVTEKVGADEKLLVLDHFKQSAGKASGVGYAKIYKTKEAMEKIERKHILNRNFKKKEEKKKE